MEGVRSQSIQALALEVLSDRLGGLADREILEIGPGDGALSRRLVDAGARVTCLDLDEPEKPIEGLVGFVRRDLGCGSLGLGGARFDAVIATEVLEHLRAPWTVLSSMVGALAPGAVLVLTIPNYWNLKYRLRYLMTGNVQTPFFGDSRKRARYHRGHAPHVNVLTYPTLKTVLRWEGCGGFALRSARRLSRFQRLRLLPWWLLVRAGGWLGRERRARYLLGETNQSEVLLGARHVLLVCERLSD